MGNFQTFEDIKAWQKARTLTKAIYELSGQGSFKRDFEFRDQIRKAAASIMSNIAEGFERQTAKEFSQFLYIAKGSAGEVRAQLYIALDQGYLDKENFHKLIQLTKEIGSMLNGLISYLRSEQASKNKELIGGV